MQKTIGDVANHFKRTINMDIPGKYSLKPMFRDISSEKIIHQGVLLFRDFLRGLYDRLIADSSFYYTPKKDARENKDSINITAEYPFLSYIKNVLTNIGYHGELNKNTFLLTDCQLLTTISVPYASGTTKAGIPIMEFVQTMILKGGEFDGF